MVLQELFAADGIFSAGIILLFLAMIAAVNRLPKKKLSFAARVLIGAACGTVFGLAVYGLERFFGSGGAVIFADGWKTGIRMPAGTGMGVSQWAAMGTQIYLGLFRFLIGPVVFICTVRMVIRTPAFREMPAQERTKRQVNTLMTALACGVGLFFGILFQVGGAGNGFGAVQAGGESIPELAVKMAPVNLAADLLAGKVTAVFAAGILTGMAAKRMSGKYMDTVKPFFDLTEAAFSIMGSVCKTVIAWKPAASAAVMTALLTSFGPEILWRIIKFLLVLVLAAVSMLILQLVLAALCGVSPAAFIRAGKAAMGKALKTRSGQASLPEAQKALAEGLGLNREITDEVSAYAISSGMQGCGALFPAMALVFAVNLAGGSFTPGLAAAALAVVTMTSYGITGAPGTATMAEFAAVMGTGMEGAVSGLGAIVAVDPIADVPRTLINVTGCMTNAIIAERRLRK